LAQGQIDTGGVPVARPYRPPPSLQPPAVQPPALPPTVPEARPDLPPPPPADRSGPSPTFVWGVITAVLAVILAGLLLWQGLLPALHGPRPEQTSHEAGKPLGSER
jgi:hypothetical protein